MSPTRRVVSCASFVSCLMVLSWAAVASAQFYDPTLRSLDFGLDDVARSPRLLGMGGLSLVVPDRNASYSLWDLAALPAGLYADDTTSTLDLRPGTDALSSVSRIELGRERQDLASRRTATQTEAVYRNHETGSMFGFVGDLSSLRWDHPYAPTIAARGTTLPIELRESLVHPEANAILGGEIPRYFHHHLRWGAHLRFRDETVEDQYRLIVENAAGQYIDLAGGEVPAPAEFTPTSVDVNTTGIGVSTAYAMGRRTQVGFGIERQTDDIHSTNDLIRSSSEFHEKRPYWNGQAALVGGFGKSFEYGITATGRLAKSDVDWRFSADAGVGAEPLTGRGNMLTRDERSSEMRARARWSSGRATIAGSLYTEASKVLVDPPHANDATSLNRFINAAFNRAGTDTLSLPDSIVHGESRRNAWGMGAGVGYRFRHTTVGGEFHWSRDVRFTLTQGAGPQRIAWDVRGGLEQPMGARMKGRLGYAYHWVDEDDFTAGNEFKANAVSAGLGYAPAGASWTLESAYRLEFRTQDFSSASDRRQSRQNIALELHWAF